MGIKLTKVRAGNCVISSWQCRVSIGCEKNDGDVTVHPRYKKQVYDIIKLIKNNCANGLGDFSDSDRNGRKYYR